VVNIMDPRQIWNNRYHGSGFCNYQHRSDSTGKTNRPND
jgi:hypothetical protein